MVKKKAELMSFELRKTLIASNNNVSISDQCELLSISRSSFYYEPVPESPENLDIMRIIDEQYLKTPFYGVRKLLVVLILLEYKINLKRLRRLMKLTNWRTIYQKPRTTKIDLKAYKYPYLLKDLEINRANQVWAIDITYIPMKKGFMYLFAIIDLHTKYVVGWSISNSMTTKWCNACIQDAIAKYGTPEIINSDQGCQFTAKEYIDLLLANNIKISMDGKGRYQDNIFIERLWRSVKYEDVYLKAYKDGLDLHKGMKNYFEFYNNDRFHENLDYKTPKEVYFEHHTAA